MSAHQDLVMLEHDGWRALSTSGDAAAAFYDDVLADDVLFLLPGGLVIDDRDGAINAMRGTPWSSFELTDERVLELTEDCAVVAYRASARREDDRYLALINSTYVRTRQSWRLALHQQTPA